MKKQLQKKSSKERRYIKSLYIKNYKSFQKGSEIDLSPMINLFFGKNSTGKSSIFQCLRLYRQSCGQGELTPLNFLSPDEYKGQGGFDLDVGYKGIINSSDTKNNLTLGLGTAIYDPATIPKGEFEAIPTLRFKRRAAKLDSTQILNATSDDELNLKNLKYNKKFSSLSYTYKYVKNFYKREDFPSDLQEDLAIYDKTALSGMKIKHLGNDCEINFPEHVIFREGDSTDKYLKVFSERRGMPFYNIERFRAASNYQSVYPPYYYKVNLPKEKIKIRELDVVWKIYKKNSEKTLILLELIREMIEGKIKNFKSNSKKNKEEFDTRFKAYQERDKKYNKNFLKNKKATEAFKKSNEDKACQRMDWFIKNKDCLGLFLDDTSDIFHSNVETHKFILAGVEKIIKFLNYNNQQEIKITEKKFNDFFLNDIHEKAKNLIYYRGSFLVSQKAEKEGKVPKTTRDHMRFLEIGEDRLCYLLNSIVWVTSGRISNVNLFRHYDEGVATGRMYRNPNDIITRITSCMKKVYVVPGLRTLPKKYFVKGLQTSYVGPQAENLAEFLADTKMRNRTNKWLEDLDIPYEVGIRPSGNYYEIVFRQKGSKNNFDIPQTHVGLGFPLILPFVVQCIRSENQILIAEEPEVHLHPKLEADLADLIIWSAKERGNQFFLETHSEDFLLRILKHIRKGKINPEDISVNYITKDSKRGSKVNSIKINKQGNYTTPWKDDMFAQRTDEFID